MEHLLAGLNRAQHEAVTATEGYVRVIAGAGSGKTRALSHRFAYLVNELGILPGNILCVTFTNKSANEMRQRIHALTGDNDTGYINTFHGFCVSVLQEDSHAVQYPKSFLVLDNSDIDALQYELMEVLCGYHGNLFIVGDPDQTIYTWRGANVKYLLDFDKVFPNVQTIMMMENYRSTPEILAAANSLIAKNGHRIKKDLLPTKPSGEKVVCHFADTQEAEAQWMAGEMQRLHDRGVPLRDMTVLYRAHYVTRAVEEALMHEKIPYTIYSGVQFFDRMEIKDALSYLRMIAYQDDLSFRRIANAPKRNLGKRRMAFLQETAEKEGTSLYVTLKNHLEDSVFSGTKAKQFVDLIERFSHSYQGRPISEVLSDILDKSGYEKALRTEGGQERLDDLAELKQSIYEYETSCGEESTMEHYLAHIALFSNGDVAEQGDKVKLMTVHAAKGLEFPYVFLCGMNEGIFPSRKVRTLPGMEEERRLAFVALTRAEKGLYLSEADGWNFDGSPRYPSRFLLDIDRELLSFTHEVDETLLREAADDVARRDKYLREDDGDGTRCSARERCWTWT